MANLEKLKNNNKMFCIKKNLNFALPPRSLLQLLILYLHFFAPGSGSRRFPVRLIHADPEL